MEPAESDGLQELCASRNRGRTVRLALASRSGLLRDHGSHRGRRSEDALWDRDASKEERRRPRDQVDVRPARVSAGR